MMQRGASRFFFGAFLLLSSCGVASLLAARKASLSAPPRTAPLGKDASARAFAAATGGAVRPAALPGDARSLRSPLAGKKPTRRWKVSGKVMQTSEYCGGAQPPEEILEALLKEKPFPNKRLFVRAGTVNKIARPILQSFTTNAEGHFEISLPSGDYCVFEEGKKDQLKIPDFSKENEKLPPAEAYRLTSEECLRTWWHTCDKTLRVKGQSLKGVIIRFHQRCNPPCVTGGPQPT